MSIVVITIPEDSKRQFVAEIQKLTGGAVGLVVVQQQATVTRTQQWRRALHSGCVAPHQQFLAALALKFRPKLRQTLTWFRARATTPPLIDWSAPTINTNDINHPDVVSQIAAINPSLLVTWGCGMVHAPFLALAPAINLHLGITPAYRGAVANQFAVGCADLENVGFTIHFLNERADAGAIIHQHRAEIHPDPQQTFETMNEHAFAEFVRVVNDLYRDPSCFLNATIPDSDLGRNIALRDWTPAHRYQLARRMLHWQHTQQPPNTPLPLFASTVSERSTPLFL